MKTAIGIQCLTLGTTCNYSTAIGAKALYNSNGNENTAIGFESQYVGGKAFVQCGHQSVWKKSISAVLILQFALDIFFVSFLFIIGMAYVL